MDYNNAAEHLQKYIDVYLRDREWTIEPMQTYKKHLGLSFKEKKFLISPSRIDDIAELDYTIEDDTNIFTDLVKGQIARIQSEDNLTRENWIEKLIPFGFTKEELEEDEFLTTECLYNLNPNEYVCEECGTFIYTFDEDESNLTCDCPPEKRNLCEIVEG